MVRESSADTLPCSAAVIRIVFKDAGWGRYELQAEVANAGAVLWQTWAAAIIATASSVSES